MEKADVIEIIDSCQSYTNKWETNKTEGRTVCIRPPGVSLFYFALQL